MSALVLCGLEIIGYCSECGTKVYDEHMDLNIIDLYSCPNCNKLHALNELYEYIPVKKNN